MSKVIPNAIGKSKVFVKDDNGEDIMSLNLHLVTYMYNDITYAHSLEGNVYGCGETLHEARKDFSSNFTELINFLISNGKKTNKELPLAPDTVIDMYLNLAAKQKIKAKSIKRGQINKVITSIANTLYNVLSEGLEIDTRMPTFS